MANALYPPYKQSALEGTSPDLTTAAVKAVLVDTGAGGYAYAATHAFLSDVPAAARLATTLALATKTVANGVFDAADANLPDAGGGATGEALIVYVDTGVETSSRLLAYIDTATGLPITLDGTDDTITWAAAGIFEI